MFRKTAAFLLSLIVAFAYMIPAAAVTAAVNDALAPENFDIYSYSGNLPQENDGVYETPSGATKMLALEDGTAGTEKVFTDLYNMENYTTYGTKYTVKNYGAEFSENKIISSDSQSKIRLKNTNTLTDFDAEFTIQKLGNASLYGGIAFRIQDEDFRTATFGTRGYMLYLNSAATSSDVQVILRRYSTASAYDTDSFTATGLLLSPMNGVRTEVSVSGSSLTFTIYDAQDETSSYTNSFSLRPSNSNGEYFSSGSFGFVSNGNHEFSNISLNGTVHSGYTDTEKRIYNLNSENSYTVHGNSTAENYGAVFEDGKISTASQTKLKINGYSDIEDFTADFSLTKTNGNSLYGGIAFHVQDIGFKAGTFGGPGYMLFANSTAASMDVQLILRNYLTATSYIQTTVANIEGLLAAPTDGVHIRISVTGNTAAYTISDIFDDTRASSGSFSLYSSDAKAGNYPGGSIAFVSNGTHDFTDISVSRRVNEKAYINVENFQAQADICLPDSTSIQGGIIFYVQSASNQSPGLSGYALSLVRTASTADNSVSVQLVRYGTDAQGNINKNLGAIKTQPVAGILSTDKGAGETLRLSLRVIRGMLSFSLENLDTGTISGTYEMSLPASSTASSVTYSVCYESGAVGYFTNTKDIGLSGLTVRSLSDCNITVTPADGGTVSGGGIYSYSQTVTIEAKPDYDYYFDGWYDGGGAILCQDEIYSFTATEDLEIIPVFRRLSVRFAGFDADTGCIVTVLDDVLDVTDIGYKISVITEQGETKTQVSTSYVNSLSAGKAPYIITSDNVYYCDIDASGDVNAQDLVALRSQLLGLIPENKFSDLNGDGLLSVTDLVRFKKLMADGGLILSDVSGDYIYPFSINGLIQPEGKMHMELSPYLITDSKQTSGSPRYLTFSDGILISSSVSENHTPFGKLRIACIGDSITQGIGATGWSSGDYSGAYPQQMGVSLGSDFEIGNFGRGSSYVYYYTGRNETLWYPNTAEYENSNTFDPDIVIIKLGTNDARVVTDAQRAQEWKSQFSDLINHYKSLPNSPKIYIVSCITMGLYDETLEANLTDYILPLQGEVAQELGCGYIDAYTGLYEFFSSGQGFASDKLHPNNTGYAALAQYIENALDFDIYF